MKVILAWFNGNKMNIGVMCLALASTTFFDAIPVIDQILNWAGAILAPLGLGHKIVKGVNNT